MANIKKYIVEHDSTMGSITVEIDFDFIFNPSGTEVWNMDRMIKEMVEFWSGSEYRLAENDGSYVNTYLIQLLKLCLGFGSNISTEKLIELIDDEEGYLKVDGTDGIRLVQFTECYFDDQSDYSITIK
jgi:Protein of unknown function (DUF2528)